MTRRRSQADEQALQRALRSSPVFRHGSPAALAGLVAKATPFDYPAGSFLFRQGEPAAFVLVLTAGEVAIVSPVRGGAEQVHTIVRAGELIGELALLTDGRRTAGARASSATTAWAIGRDDFWAFLELRRSGEITFGGWLRSILRRQMLPYFAWTDPMPSLARAATPLRSEPQTSG